MFKAVLTLLVASGLNAPTASMDVLRHLLNKLPDVNETGQSAGADVSLWISPDGKVIGCDISRFVGDESFARLICPALEEYQFSAPRSASGTSVYADISLPITAFPDRERSHGRLISGLNALRKLADDARYLELGSLRWRDNWRLVVEVDEDGAVTGCARESKEVNDDLAEQACAIASNQTFARRSGADGNPVRYVKTLEARPS